MSRDCIRKCYGADGAMVVLIHANVIKHVFSIIWQQYKLDRSNNGYHQVEGDVDIHLIIIIYIYILPTTISLYIDLFFLLNGNERMIL